MSTLLATACLWLGLWWPALHGDLPVDRIDGPVRSLAGRLLVADESLADPDFARTVVLRIRHDRRGAFGLVVDRFRGEVPAARLLDRLRLPQDGATEPLRIGYGGPFGPDTLLVLHTDDRPREGTETVAPGIALSRRPDIIVDIARGRGPARHLVTLGYAGWAPGQLEAEIARGDWGVADADPTLLFDTPPESMWQRARASIAVEL